MAGLSNFLAKLGLGVPTEVRSLAALAPGRVRIRGTLAAASPLTSPMRRKPCAGFHYTCSYRTTTPKGFVRRPLRTITSWAQGITLRVDDGELTLVPPAGEPFSREEHLKLRDHGFDDFRAREDVLHIDLEVVVEGKAKRDGDRWLVQIGQIIKDNVPEKDAQAAAAEDTASPAENAPDADG